MSSSGKAWKSDTTFQNLLTEVEDARDVTLAARDEILNKYGTLDHLAHEIDSDYYLGIWKVDPSTPDVTEVVELSQETITPGYNSSESDPTTGDVVLNLNTTYPNPPVAELRVLNEHLDTTAIAAIASGSSGYDLVKALFQNFDGTQKDLTTYGDDVYFVLEIFGYTV